MPRGNRSIGKRVKRSTGRSSRIKKDGSVKKAKRKFTRSKKRSAINTDRRRNIRRKRGKRS